MSALTKEPNRDESFSEYFVEVKLDELLKGTEKNGETLKLRVRCEYPEIQVFNSITHAIPDPSVPVKLVVELKYNDAVIEEDGIFLQLFFSEDDGKARNLYRELNRVQVKPGLLKKFLGYEQSFLLERALVRKFQGEFFSLGSYEYPYSEIVIPVIFLKKGGKLSEFLRKRTDDEIDCLFLSESLGFSVFQKQIACSGFYLQEIKRAVTDVVKQSEEFRVICRLVGEGSYEFATFPGKDVKVFFVRVREKLPEFLPYSVEDKQILYVYHGLFGQSLNRMFDHAFSNDFFSLAKCFRDAEMQEIDNGEKVLSFVVDKNDIVKMLEKEVEFLKKEREMIESHYRSLIEGVESIKNVLSSSFRERRNLTVVNKGPKIFQ